MQLKSVEKALKVLQNKSNAGTYVLFLLVQVAVLTLAYFMSQGNLFRSD